MTTTRETPDTTTTKTTTPTPATAQRDWFDQYLTFVKRVEAPVVRTTARMATRFAEYVPERPAFLASMPKVHDVMSTGITVRKRMVDEQTRFARQMMKAMDPMLVRVDTIHVEQHDPKQHDPKQHDQKREHAPTAAPRRPVRRPEPARAARAG